MTGPLNFAAKKPKTKSGGKKVSVGPERSETRNTRVAGGASSSYDDRAHTQATL